MSVEGIFPSYIDNTDFRYIKIDDKYISSIIIYDFPEFNTFLSITESIPKDINYTMSIYVQKQDTYKILKELTYFISTSKSEIRTAKTSQIDIDVITRHNSDANSLRKEIQINNQEIFYLNFILTFYSDSIDKLLKTVKRFQSKLYSKQLYSKITNFRHLEEYVLNLPLNKKNSNILKQNYGNFTTNSLTNIFPFYTKTLFDISGVIFGKIISQNSLCAIDIFNSSYLNSNMCILGSSGAGKSFFSKLLIIRHYINKKIQYIFDIEGEYTNLVNTLNGSIFDFKSNFFNIMQIYDFEVNVYKSKFYEQKTKKVLKFLKELFEISDNSIIRDFENAINKAYKKYSITDDINSVYENGKNIVYINKVIKSSDKFPNLTHLKEFLELKKSLKILEKAKNKYSYFFGNTDIDLNSKIINFDLSTNTLVPNSLVIKHILETLVLKIKSLNMLINTKEKTSVNTIVYMDEFWKYSIDIENELSRYIFELFKTIRKLMASIVVITQDICDIFSKENENYGKSILNNCFFKVIFRLDFSDIELLSKISGINNDLLENVNLLDKGEAVLFFSNNNIKLCIKASKYEMSIIKEEQNAYFGST